MNKQKNKKILFILPSNLGDVVLALPAIDAALAFFDRPVIDCVVSKRTLSFLKKAQEIDGVLVWDKSWNWKHKMRFALSLRGKYDFVFDFKNTILPLVVSNRFFTPLFRRQLDNGHKKDFYPRMFFYAVKHRPFSFKRSLSFAIDIKHKEYFNRAILRKSVFIAPASRFAAKNYTLQGYCRIIAVLARNNNVVIVAEPSQSGFVSSILSKIPLNLQRNVVNLCGKTAVEDLFFLFGKYAYFLICPDSAPLHIASYLNIPVLGLFGATSYKKYGPWSENSIALPAPDNAKSTSNIRLEDIFEAMRILCKKQGCKL